MGTAGNREGTKLFSFNTTVRNPDRNLDFLKTFIPYNGKLFTKELKIKYLFDIIKNGIYVLSDISEEIKNKIQNDIPLSDSEVKEAIDDNPQACGWPSRVTTQLRALKDEGFLKFEDSEKGKDKYVFITKLGFALINDSNSSNHKTYYTKAMIGTQGNSPARAKMENKCVPFLNTLFVIDGVNKEWELLGNEPKGIKWYEFAVFVLSMKDCNYKQAIKNIIEYRKRFGNKYNYDILLNFLRQNNIVEYNKKTLNAYYDDVFRKFAMTELVIKHGMFSNKYINFSQYNIEKVHSILNKYKNYKWIEYKTKDQYYDNMFNIELPWETDEKLRLTVIHSKASNLGIKIDSSLPIDKQEEMIDRVYYNTALEKVINEFDYKRILKELLILGRYLKVKSSLDDIAEPMRLEYLVTLLIGKKYGTKGLVPNMAFDSEGYPLHYAGAGKCDLKYFDGKNAYIFELTMQTSKMQLTNETSSVIKHLISEEKKGDYEYRAALIAPNINLQTTIWYYPWSQKKKAIPVSINKFVDMVHSTKIVIDLNEIFDSILNKLQTLDSEQYTDFVNKVAFNEEFDKFIDN